MYHDIEHEHGCQGRYRAKPEMRDCTCGKIIDCLLAERNGLNVTIGKQAAQIRQLQKRLAGAGVNAGLEPISSDAGLTSPAPS